MFFLNPLASEFKVWPVFFLETDFLFKSILTWCASLSLSQPHTVWLSRGHRY